MPPTAVAPKAPAAPRFQVTLRPAELPRDDLVEDATIKGRHYNGEILTGRDAEAVEIEQSRFENTRFTGTRLTRSILSHLVVDTCDFSSVRTQDVSLLRSTVTGSKLTGSVWSNGSFRDVVFENTRIDSALIRYAKLKQVVFRGCNMQGVDFQFAELRGVLFERCDLTGAQFGNASLANTRFEGGTLIDVGGAEFLKGATVQGPGGIELALSLARQAGISFEP